MSLQPELVVHEHFYIPQLNRTRHIRVLLPPDYWLGNRRRYPVAYLQDGQNLFDAYTSAYGHWHLREAMAKQPNKRQAILVGIDNGHHHRLHEYSPFKRGGVGGDGDAYLQFIVQTLKPFIDERYRTLPQRDTTAIAGSSMGGLIALYAGLRYAHTFGMAGVLSPSIWFNPEVMRLSVSKHYEPCHLYLCASATEMGAMAAQMTELYSRLQANGFPKEKMQMVLRSRGRHNEAFWGREFKPMYEWLFDHSIPKKK